MQLAEARHAFSGLLDHDRVQLDGHVLLGTPLGRDGASVHVGSVAYWYRRDELLRMVDDHDTNACARTRNFARGNCMHVGDARGECMCGGARRVTV